MNYRKEIYKLLFQLDEQQLKFIYNFLKAMLD